MVMVICETKYNTIFPIGQKFSLNILGLLRDFLTTCLSRSSQRVDKFISELI